MFRIRQWSNQRKAAAAATLALLLWLPSGLSSTGPVVTGHSTFYKGEAFDPCLASIVGVMQTDVRWFNDMVLTSRYGGKGTFIYVTEKAAPDPRNMEHLFSDGVSYPFTDPNGAQWTVEELWYTTTTVPSASVEPGNANSGSVNDWPSAVAIPEDEKYYVWVVELSAQPIYDLYAPSDKNDPNYHTIYNWVAIVDTCRFHKIRDSDLQGGDTRPIQNNPDGNRIDTRTGEQNYTIEHDGPMEADEGHRPDDRAHTHEAFLANVYVGQRPIISQNPNVNRADPAWQDTWAGVGIG